MSKSNIYYPHGCSKVINDELIFSQSNKGFLSWEEQIVLHDTEARTLFCTFFFTLSLGYYPV